MGTSITLQVTGFVVGDPQMKTVGDNRLATFSVAVNPKVGDSEKQTLWVQVHCWNKLADVAEQYVKRASLVQVAAEWLRLNAWVAHDDSLQASLNLDANRLILLDRREDDEPENDIGMWF